VKRLWLVAYDVTDARRLRRVFRLLRQWGVPVQYSVFECHLSDSEVERLAQALADALDEAADRAHLYPLCGQCAPRARVLGRGGRAEALPEAWIVSDG